MPDKKKESCCYIPPGRNIPCGRETKYKKDDKFCVFHFENRKKDKVFFTSEFIKLLENNDKNFEGFIFPENFYLWGERDNNLQGRDLSKANLIHADLRGAELYKPNLRKAELHNSDLRGAKLYNSNLCKAILPEAKLQGAILRESNLRDANLQDANLQGADLRNTSFEKTNVAGVLSNRDTLFRGIYVTHAIGSQQFVRFAKDQDYLEELRSTKCGRFIYRIWWLFADCGRSFLRWASWSIGFAIMFACIFCSLGPDNFAINSTLPFKFITMLYYSVVTFTTLGFGDIIPNTTCASIWVMVEVVMGYIMLGGLISILANKLARRS